MLLGLSALLFAACSGGPKVTVCILDSANATLECSDENGKEKTLPLADADKYICMSPSDAQELFNYVKTKCEKK